MINETINNTDGYCSCNGHVIITAEQTKICRNRNGKGCGEEKPISEFISGRNICRECKNKISKQYKNKHKKEISEYNKQYRKNNKEKCAELYHQHYLNHKAEKAKHNKNYKFAHRKESAEREKLRRQTNLNFRVAKALRNRLYRAIQTNQKTGSAVNDLGCSIPDLKLRLESLFQTHPLTGEIMSWENYGEFGWHIDHIIPISHFDLTDREQFLIACHYLNLQPMWATENLSKHNKLPDNFEQLIEQIKAAIKNSMDKDEEKTIEQSIQETISSGLSK